MVHYWILLLFLVCAQCSTFYCFEVISNSTDVCTSQGICTSTDVCECFDYDNYGGVECNITRCYGIDNTNDAMCNGHGTCDVDTLYQGKHTCDCEEGYGGFECVDDICFGIYSDNITYVCSGRGECVGNDTCECTNSGGDMCETGACDGILAYDELVCGGRGICIEETGICQNCSEGYRGDFCEEGSCYGIFPGEEGVCNGHGTCYGLDFCVCDKPFFGVRCELWPCYGKNSTSLDVCSGHGWCISQDRCECFSDEYYGSECENFDCFDVVNILDFLTCSGHGECIDKDVCLCDTGYEGDECGDFSCAGVHWNTTGVCGGNGVCYLPNYCVCQGSYFGEVDGAPCLYLDCFGYWNIENSVCSAHGECVELDTCDCEVGWEGVKCDTPYCGEYLAITDNEDLICSTHGECVSYDECICEGNYGTWNCSKCLPNYHGDDCDVAFCLASITCTGHGFCNDNLECTCDESFDGQFCDQCTSQLYGTNCDIVCNDTDHCFDHGDCSEIMCTCHESEELGFWVKGTDPDSDPLMDCDSCVEGWYGRGCTLRLETNFTFSDYNDRIFGTVVFFPHTIQTLSNYVIHEDDRDQFGIGPMIRWILDFTVFEIIFGEGATLLPGDTFRFNLLYIDQFIHDDDGDYGVEEEWFTCLAEPAENPTLPTAVLAGPSVISACDDLTLSSTSSSTTDGRGLNFEFSVTEISSQRYGMIYSSFDNCSTPERYEYLQNVTGLKYIDGETICANYSSVYVLLMERNRLNPKFPQATIFSSNLTVGFTYAFALRVRNEFSLESELTTFDVYVSSEVVPQVYISGGSTTRVVAYKSPVYTIEGYGMICGVQIPESLDTYFTYSWRKIRGAEVTHMVENGGKRIIFTKTRENGWFKYIGSYTYEFSIASVEVPDLMSSITIPIEVVGSELVALIEGGNRTVQSPYYMPVDGSGSYDPDGIEYEGDPYYFWTCKNLALNSFCTDDFLGVDQETSFFRHMLYTGEYLINLRFQKGNREAYSVVHYVVIDEPIDVYVSVSSIEPFVNANEALVMEGSVEFSDSEFDYFTENSLGNIFVNWTLDGEPFPNDFRFTRPGELVLGVSPDVFVAGEKYIIGFSATWSKSGNASFESRTEVNVNSPPLPGTFTVTRKVTEFGENEDLGGVGFVDDFEMMALYWNDEQLPLTFTYYYQRESGTESQQYVMIPETGKNEITTRIPILEGNITIWVEVKDSLGASTFSSSPISLEAIKLTDMDDMGNITKILNSTQLVNETVVYYVEKAEESQSYSECAAEMNAVNEFFLAVSNMGILSSSDTLDVATMISLGWESCGGDSYYVPTASSTSLTINTASNFIEAMVSAEDIDEDGNVVEVPIPGDLVGNVIDSMEEMGGLGAETMTPENVDEMANVCGSLIDGLSGGNVDSSPEETDDMVTQVINIVSEVSATLASGMVVGQPPQLIKNDVFQIAASLVRDTDVEVQYGEVKIGLLDEIKTFTPVGERRAVGTENSVEVTSVEYYDPPFSRGVNLTGPGTNIVFGKGGSIIPPQPLSEPLPITLVSNISSAPLTDNPREAGERPFCAWLDEESNIWVTEGCELVSYGDATAVCECTEAENYMFSTVFEFAEPDLNVLSADDFANITKLSVDNMTALIFVCCAAIVYMLVVLFFELFGIFGPKVRAFLVKRYMAQKGPEKYRAHLESEIVQAYIMDYVRDNLWLSVFFIPPDERYFPRAQRLTVLYLVFLGVFLVNALTFGNDEGNFAQAFFSSIISSILIFPVGLVEVCYGRVDARQILLSSTRDVRKVMDDEMRERFATQLGLDYADKKDEGAELEAEEEQDMGVFERVVRGVSVVLFSIQQMIISFQDWMENSSAMITVSLFIIFIFIILYFCMVIFCNIGAIFYMDWLGELGAVIISAAAVTTFLIFFLFLFWYNKRNRYTETVKSGEFIEWSSTQFKIVNVILFAVCCIILFLLLFSCVSMHFLDVVSYQFLIPVELCLLVLIIASFLWLFTVFVEPKQKKKKERKKGKKKEEDEESNNLLPHYFSYPIYFFSYFVAAWFSFLIVLYGIKFDSDPNAMEQDSAVSTSGRWLLGSGGGILSDFSLMTPVETIFKTIAIYCIIQMFSRVFLSF